MEAITRSSMELEKRVKSLEAEKNFLLQPNEKLWQRSCSTGIHPSGEKKTLIGLVLNELAGIDTQVKDTIHLWCRNEVYELRQYGGKMIRAEGAVKGLLHSYSWSEKTGERSCGILCFCFALAGPNLPTRRWNLSQYLKNRR